MCATEPVGQSLDAARCKPGAPTRTRRGRASKASAARAADGSQTRRWREVDSNQRYPHAREALDSHDDLGNLISTKCMSYEPTHMLVGRSGRRSVECVSRLGKR